MNDIFCRIKNLSFAYEPGVSVLSIDKLELERGRITTFRGHNGSGKTTLLKCLGNLLPLSASSIEIGQEDNTVLVQQEPYLFQGSVKQNLLYPLKFRGIARGKDRSARIDEVLDFVGLRGFERRKARLLSGGEMKRVAIARALMAESSVLMLDEPNANVDRSTSRALEELFLRLRDKGITLVISSHDDRLAYRVSDRIIDLEMGVPVEHFETILKGEYEHREGLYSRFVTEGINLFCPSLHGSYTTAVLSADDIFLSRDRMMKEGYNQLEGVVEAINDYEADHHIILLNCGFPVRVRLSGAAFQLLAPSVGTIFFALISPSAVHLY